MEKARLYCMCGEELYFVDNTDTNGKLVFGDSGYVCVAITKLIDAIDMIDSVHIEIDVDDIYNSIKHKHTEYSIIILERFLWG